MSQTAWRRRVSVHVFCMYVRLSSARLESERLKSAADADKPNQPERITQLLTEMRSDQDKVLSFFSPNSLESEPVAVLGRNIWGAWPLIIWEATTAKQRLSEITIEPIKNWGAGQDLGGCAPWPQRIEPPLENLGFPIHTSVLMSALVNPV